MDATTKTQFKVGVFLGIGILILLISIFMIGGTNSLFSKQIRLHAHFDQVQGLAPGSLVSLAGLSIGNIEDIVFLPDQNKLDVVMQVDAAAAKRITEGSQVEIRTQGALGDKFIYVIPADPRNPPVPEGSVLAIAAPTDLFGIISERGKETEKVFDVINEIYVMTKAINHEGRLEKMMNNLSAASQSLKETSDQARQFTTGLDLNKSSAQLKSTIQRMESIVQKIDRGDGTLGALINDSSLHDQLRGLLGASPRRQQSRSMIRTSIEKADKP